MHVFFKPDIQNGLLWLDAEESRHCVKVLRMRQGHQVVVTDGKGNAYQAELSEANPKACLLKITGEAVASPPRPFELHLAVAPTKNIDRFEWLLEKATECGIDYITPVICQYSERTVIKPERLQKILIAAMKQSQRTFLPSLNNAVALSDLFKIPFTGKKFIAHCEPTDKKKLSECYTKGENMLLLVGPEGDFSSEEISMAQQEGFQAISIGSHRLRTETAALTLCIQANTLNDLL